MKEDVTGTAYVVTTAYAEPTLNAVSQTSIYQINDPDIKPVSDQELEDMVARLLAVAHASGKNVTIENNGVPAYGMGGYRSIAHIRPNYPTARATMTEMVRRLNGEAVQPVAGVTRDTMVPRPLKAAEVPWPNAGDAFRAMLQIDPALLPHHRVVELVREMDRRFMQLWDKIGFERVNGLVDYSKLQQVEVPTLYPVISQALSSGNNYYLSVFESRYSRGTVAMLAFDMQFPLIVEDYFSGGDEDDAYIGGLTRLEHYPLAVGDNVHEALRNLDKKLRGITITKNTPPFLTWLKYVTDVNDRVKEQKVYEIVAVEAEMILDEQLEAANASGV